MAASPPDSPSSTPHQKPSRTSLSLDLSNIPPLIHPSPPSNTLLITVCASRPPSTRCLAKHAPTEPPLLPAFHTLISRLNTSTLDDPRSPPLIFATKILSPHRGVVFHHRRRHQRSRVPLYISTPPRPPGHSDLFRRAHSVRTNRSTSPGSSDR